MPEFQFRAATPDSAALITSHRRLMFAAIGKMTQAELDRMAIAFEPWVRERLANRSYLGWLAVANNGTNVEKVAAGVGLWIMDWPPGRLDWEGKRAYILNVYTEPEFRGHGLATQLVKIALDECRSRGLSMVILHASDFGRPIYERLGFVGTNEMRLELALDDP
jgi:GNAT superfamily N-acetyltransferase